jgi:hypothetical protein
MVDPKSVQRILSERKENDYCGECIESKREFEVTCSSKEGLEIVERINCKKKDSLLAYDSIESIGICENEMV